MRKTLVFMAILYFPLAGVAQIGGASSIKPKCDSLLQAGDGHLNRQHLQLALQCYLGAMNCNSQMAGKVGPKIEKVFKAMDRQKESLKTALNKADALIRYFNFENENTAWAYDSGKRHFAVVNKAGVRLTEYLYENPEPFRNGVAVALVSNQFVFVKGNGEEQPGRYDYLIPVTQGRYVAGNTNLQPIMVNGQGEIETSSNIELYGMWRNRIYSDPDPEIGYQMFIAAGEATWEAVKEKGGKWKFLDTTGQAMITLQYDYVGEFSEGLALIQRDGKYGFIDHSGREVIAAQYEDVGSFSEGLAMIKIDRRFGFIDHTGREVITPQYEDSGSFSKRLAGVKKDGRWGFIDANGREVVAPQYEKVGVFLEGMAWAQKEGKWGFIDANGREVVSAKYDEPGRFSGGLSPVKKSGKWIYIDTIGREVLSFQEQYNFVAPFFEGFACVEKGGKWGFIDITGQQVVVPVYESASSFSGGLARIKRDGKWGLLDINMREVVHPQYQEIRHFFSPSKPFLEGCLALLKKDGKWGVMDINMRILPPKFESINPFFDGFAIVTHEEKQGLLDSAFQERLPCIYTKISKSGYCIYLLEQNGRFGLFAPDYNILLPCDYEQIGYVGEENGWIRVQQSGKWGWVACEQDEKGIVKPVIKIPCRFDAVTPFQNGKARVIQIPYPDSFKINDKGEMLPDYE